MQARFTEGSIKDMAFHYISIINANSITYQCFIVFSISLYLLLRLKLEVRLESSIRRCFYYFPSLSKPLTRGIYLSYPYWNAKILRSFYNTRKMLKTLRINILRFLITNIYSKFRVYTVVVVKWSGGMRGWLVDPSSAFDPILLEFYPLRGVKDLKSRL